MSSILHILVQNPDIAKACPKFVDTRQFRTEQIRVAGDARSPVSPLAELLRNCIPILLANVESLWSPPVLSEIPPSIVVEVNVQTLKQYSDLW